MKLDELRTVQSKERRKDSLQQLRDSFYRDVATYLQDLKANRDRRAQQVDDPFGDNEVRRLSDELETAEEVAEAVYERRVGKVVKLASFAAADMPVDDEGMTGEERALFEDLVERITQNKQAVLDVLSGGGEAAETATADPSVVGPPNPVEATPQESEPSIGEPAASTPTESDSVLAEAMGSESNPTAESTDPTETTSAASAATTAAESTEPTAASDSDSPSPGSRSGPEPGSTPTEPATSSTETEVPPPDSEPQTEPDAVLGTTTDGGTATHSTNEPSSAATEPPTAADGTAETPESTGTTQSTQSTGSAEPTGSADDDTDRTTVRITKNVGEIFGVDGREYTLQSEDVVTLPTTNVKPLVERDAAQPLE